jgi:hypothetical protein
MMFSSQRSEMMTNSSAKSFERGFYELSSTSIGPDGADDSLRNCGHHTVVCGRDASGLLSVGVAGGAGGSDGARKSALGNSCDTALRLEE